MKNLLVLALILFNSVILSQSNNLNSWIEIFEYLEKNSVTDGVSKNYNYLGNEVFENGLGNTNLKIGIEHLRVDEKEQEIIVKKSEYPIPDIRSKLVERDLINSVAINMYARLFKIPITTINILENQKESFYTIGLIIIPVNKIENTYTFRLSFLVALKIYGEYTSVWFRGQNINMEIGEKIKIELDHKIIGQHVDINNGINDKSKKKKVELRGMYGAHNSIYTSGDYWKISPTINGKVVEFTSEDKFFEGKKDYLILSFEKE